MRFQKSAVMAKKLSVHNVRMQTGEGEEGGDAGELVAARDIRFTQIQLTKNQFNELLGSEIAVQSCSACRAKSWNGVMALTLTALLPRHIDTLDLEEFFGKVVTLQLSFSEVDEEAAKENADNQGKLELEGGAAGDEDNGENDENDEASVRRRRNGDETRAH